MKVAKSVSRLGTDTLIFQAILRDNGDHAPLNLIHSGELFISSKRSQHLSFTFEEIMIIQ